MKHRSIIFPLVVVATAVLVSVSGLAAYGSVNGQSLDPAKITIYRDGDSLTLDVINDGIVSLVGLTFQVTDGQTGDVVTRQLAQFPAYQGLPFDRIVAPLCFQLRSSQYAPALPTACRQLPASQLLTQYLTPSDLIWYDSRAEEGIPVTITNGTDSDPGQICPNSAPSCDIVYTPPIVSATPTANPTGTPAYTVIPLAGRAVVKKSTLFRAGPGPQYDVVASVNGGTYTITGQNAEQTYYQIDYNGVVAWVSAFSSNVSFDVQALPTMTGAPTDVPLDATLQYGQIINGSLARNQKTNYKFVGLGGEPVSISVIAKFDAVVEFYDAAGFLLAEDENTGGIDQPQVNGFLLPKNGEYHIVLRGYSAHDIGKFQLTLLKGKIPTPVKTNTISYGQKITDFLAPNGQATYSFQGKEGDVVSVEVDAGFDNYVQLNDVSGNKLVSDDGSGGQFTSLIDLFTLPTSGIYQLLVRGFSARSSGTYILKLFQSFAAGEQVAIQYGQTLNNQIDSQGRRVFVFSAAAGDRITVTVQSGFDTHLTLRDQRGAIIADDDDSGGNLQPALFDFKIAKKGIYFLLIFGNNAADSGSFTVTLSVR